MTRLALVAGGSGGIGAGVCDVLARDGWDVALTYHRNSDAAELTAKAVQARGRQAHVTQLDLTDADATAAWVNSFEQVDCVVYAAGPQVPMRYTSVIEPATFAAQLQRDAAAAFNLLQPSIARLRDRGGVIVALVTTVLTRYATRDLLSAAPKAAVEQLVRAIAAEEGRHGVRANCIGVGVIQAGMWDDLLASGDYGDAALEAALKATPLKRFGTAAEIGEVVSFLASSASSYVTGQTINVDGGYSV